MIIGNGMLANEFIEYKADDKILIFASGVSNSNEISIDSFKREELLLKNTIKSIGDKKIVYFSTCSVYDTYFDDNAYTRHKLEMENLITKMCTNYLICRLPQVLGSNNKSQLMGFLYENIKNNKLFNLYDIERNIIDITDVKKIVNYILKYDSFKNKIINIANPTNVKVLDIVKKIEQIYHFESNYKLIDKSGDFNIDTSEIKFIIKELNLFGKNYIEKRIRKYYG